MTDKPKYYEGEFEDAIIGLPTNAVGMTVSIDIYENGEIIKAEQTFDMNDIKGMKDDFWKCVDGEYPKFTITDEGIEYLKSIGEIVE